MAEFEQYGSFLNKCIVTVETNNQWKYYIKVVNDKKIHDVVAIETHVAILPFRAILAYANAPNLPIPTKWSN